LNLDNLNSCTKPTPHTFGNPTPALEPKNIPQTLTEAKAAPEWPEWEITIKAKMDILREMGT
jgi:hypothetical protein